MPMKLGAVLDPLPETPPVGALAARARELEQEGFDSLWVVQAAGRGMMISDPLVALSAAAVATERVELGTAVLQLPLYEPGALAHSIFSLMHLAGDRLQIGLGAGSTESDFLVFEKEYATRFARFDPSLEALRALLGKGAGAQFDLTPWPSLLGGPPLLYGTWGKGVARAAREFDGWIASALHRIDEEVIEKLPQYRAHGGRRAIVSSIVLRPGGGPEHHRKRLVAFAEAGFDEAVVLFVPEGPAPREVRSWVPTA